MKKICAILAAALLAAVVLCGGPAPAAAAGKQPVFMWENCAVAIQLLNYEIVKYENARAYMNLYVRVINDEDCGLSVWMKDPEIDGVGIVVSPIVLISAHSDTGTENPKKFYIFPPTEDGDAASGAIASARALSGVLELHNSDTNEVLVRQKFSIELGVLDGTRDVRTPKPAKTPTPKPTRKPTATPEPVQSTGRRRAAAYTPASTDYRTLQQGNKGQAVKDLQQRLYDLDYFADKISGTYGLSTTIAVRSFCTQNGLEIRSDATPEMQRLLYSNRAEYYMEPYVPLVIGPEFRWEDPQDGSGMGWFYAQVVNRDPDRAIRGYELYYYLTNVWGEKIGLDGAYLYPRTHVQTVEPGYCQYTTGFPDPYFAYTYSIWVGVHKIIFADGEIRETDPDSIVYFECQIKR